MPSSMDWSLQTAARHREESAWNPRHPHCLATNWIISAESYGGTATFFLVSGVYAAVFFAEKITFCFFCVHGLNKKQIQQLNPSSKEV